MVDANHFSGCAIAAVRGTFAESNMGGNGLLGRDRAQAHYGGAEVWAVLEC